MGVTDGCPGPAERRRERGGWRRVGGGDPDLGWSVNCVGATTRLGAEGAR